MSKKSSCATSNWPKYIIPIAPRMRHRPRSKWPAIALPRLIPPIKRPRLSLRPSSETTTTMVRRVTGVQQRPDEVRRLVRARVDRRRGPRLVHLPSKVPLPKSIDIHSTKMHLHLHHLLLRTMDHRHGRMVVDMKKAFMLPWTTTSTSTTSRVGAMMKKLCGIFGESARWKAMNLK